MEQIGIFGFTLAGVADFVVHLTVVGHTGLGVEIWFTGCPVFGHGLSNDHVAKVIFAALVIKVVVVAADHFQRGRVEDPQAEDIQRHEQAVAVQLQGLRTAPGTLAGVLDSGPLLIDLQGAVGFPRDLNGNAPLLSLSIALLLEDSARVSCITAKQWISFHTRHLFMNKIRRPLSSPRSVIPGNSYWKKTSRRHEKITLMRRNLFSLTCLRAGAEGTG